ncbi:Uncharacterised protein [uncultured archaeon]|nr:Uncharacterised protein [uncultured archaeon]
MLLGLTLNGSASPISGDIGVISDRNTKNAYAELNAFYSLPGKVQGYTFVDQYQDHGAYVSKTALTRNLTDNLSARLQIVEADQPFTEAGLGLKYNLHGLPNGTFACLHAMPAWFNENGREHNVFKLGYFVSQDLPGNFYLSNYGEANLAAKAGPTWCYGEIELGKRIGNLKVAANVAMNGTADGKITPELEARLAVRGTF